MADETEPTAWQDINPPMASARRPEPPCKSSAPDPRIVFRNELTACLTLVAPVGMDEDSRRDWLAVAWDSLKHVPPDILTVGAHKARLKCDHPSKIVPTVIEETAEQMRWRQERRADEHRPRIAGPEPDYCTPEEAAEILRQIGLGSEKREPPKGDTGALPEPTGTGPRRKPTRADYIALGVDPAVLDKLDEERAAPALNREAER